ncbi:ATP-dependent dethiobiotin synthetase BioD [Sphingorhabdus sp. IMCC26285]|uniref:ATP-dependent dethiobiotin synthetase BioD n=1 Tax=Sphingorhabdus profundilacus TaxID=2509718 RepID=A0A6I4LYG1_9SPHN|nr:dethiobiotin synthase [Sphingorhabdus profundilacus]MVZ98101.1 ATP-dependent dethiobiotin synthetase BioD [Sphingorhabdus profundilacus]
MTQRYIITGTDTDVGKTVFAAGLAGHFGARYWKPVQAGTEGGSDSERVRRLSGGKADVLPEAYILGTPCSPHEAAHIDGVTVDLEHLALPAGNLPLVVEGAGGVLVPFADNLLAADLFAWWGLPVILVARTSLGTINHSLLSIEALRSRRIVVQGIIFMGEENRASEEAVIRLGGIAHLGRLPRLDPLSPDTLAEAFAAFIRTDLL